jgi:hypothetical protein
MAAGLGFKDFTTGEVLTAADVDGYLMQGIWVFASTAARDAAVTAPAEGNFAFTKDTNSLWYYDGAAWVASGATGDIEGVTAGTGISGGGTSGTVTVTNSMATIIDAKGDLVVGTGDNTFGRLPIGTNSYVLTADSAETTGVKWAAVAAGGGNPAFRAFRATSDQSISNSTWTKVELNSETFDTANAFDSTTNYRFTPQTAGYYQINGQLKGYQSSYDRRIELAIYKNGSEIGLGSSNTGLNEDTIPTISDLIYFNGSSDYVELYVWIQGTSAVVRFGTSITFFCGAWIRS